MVTGWIPVILLGSSSLVIAIALLIVAAKRWRNKRLASEITQLKTELTETKESAGKVEGLEGEKQELTRQNTKLTTDLAEANSEKERPDAKRLQLVAKQDREEIQDSVIVSGVHFRNEITYGKRYIEFVFAIFNQSVYEMTIDDTLGDGDIVFNKEPLVKKKEIVENKAQNLPARVPGHFAVRQYLDSGDIEAIKNATDDRLFGLHNLRIKIKGGADFERVVKEKPLQFDCHLSKEHPIYLNYDGPFRSRFNGEIGGKIGEIYFQSKINLRDSHIISEDNYYDLFFVMRTYIANHGAPTTIERFRLAVTANGTSYEGEKQPLAGFHVIRLGFRDPLFDIEDSNDEILTDTRRGWLRFVVRGVKRYDEDNPELGIELDVIDKNEEPNRVTPLARSEWRGHNQSQGDYINGLEEWQVY